MGLRAEGLKAHCIIAAWEWPNYMSPEARDEGIKVRTSSYTRHHVNITMCKAKANGNYINSMLALREALDSGCEEALLLDNEGYVAKVAVKMYFWFKTASSLHLSLHLALKGLRERQCLVSRRSLGLKSKSVASHVMRSMLLTRHFLLQHRPS